VASPDVRRRSRREHRGVMAELIRIVPRDEHDAHEFNDALSRRELRRAR
jgi:hypothetical protein